MDSKFNSLFNNELEDDNSGKHYNVNRVDDILILNNLLLTYDTRKLKNNVELFERNFGYSKNYRLDPRSCSTRHASSTKFCNNSGMPEIYEKKIDKCKQYFIPNTATVDRSQYTRNIDLEARIRKVDFTDSKCDKKTYKADMCDDNNKDCSLSCGKKVFENDNIELNGAKYGMENIKKNCKQFCKIRNINQNQIKQDFLTFQPTKRRDIIEW
jgi:hypothetical protein